MMNRDPHRGRPVPKVHDNLGSITMTRKNETMQLISGFLKLPRFERQRVAGVCFPSREEAKPQAHLSESFLDGFLNSATTLLVVLETPKGSGKKAVQQIWRWKTKPGVN
jgi:hypothetical protein